MLTPKVFRLIARNELVDVPAGAEKKNSLRRKHSGSAAVHRRLHKQVPQKQAGRRWSSIIENEPATRVHDRDLSEEPQCQQANERHVPELDRTSQMRLKVKKFDSLYSPRN